MKLKESGGELDKEKMITMLAVEENVHRRTAMEYIKTAQAMIEYKSEVVE